jgi:hypothetical protein
MDQPAEERQILAPDGLVETKFTPQGVDMLARRSLRHKQQHRVARQAHDEEDDRHNPEDRQRRLEDAAEKIA